mmetsp:Transcript_28932/g.74272  ORF Transcript_28932/g.74272 Transcript_28932/m.74272 type:complete len:95 (-) Transcript_28932:2443-2727(-)
MHKKTNRKRREEKNIVLWYVVEISGPVFLHARHPSSIVHTQTRKCAATIFVFSFCFVFCSANGAKNSQEAGLKFRKEGFSWYGEWAGARRGQSD